MNPASSRSARNSRSGTPTTGVRRSGNPNTDQSRLRELFWSNPDHSILEEAAQRIEQMLSRVEVASAALGFFEPSGESAVAA